MKDFTGKVVALTGAASGLGRALAIRLAGERAALALCDVDEAGLKQTAELATASPRVTTRVVDVSDREAVHAWARGVEQEHGSVDVVINNAGVASRATIEDASYEDFEWVMGVNLWGVVHGVKAFLPILKTRPEAHIVNISSINAIMPFPANAPYNVSKCAVAGFSETLMQELVDTPVSVTCVHPGGIKTSILRNGRHFTEEDNAEFERVARATPDRAARIVIAGMKKRKRRLYVGAEARIMAALKLLFPMGSVALLGRLWRRREAASGARQTDGGD